MKIILLLSIFAMSSSEASSILVANRAGGTVTEIDLHSGDLRDRPGRSSSEPMYLTRFSKKIVALGDRKNDELVFSDATTGYVYDRVKTSRGIFHQYSHPLLPGQVVVATDIDRGFDLIEKIDGKFQRRSFPLPARYAEGKPHDIVHDGKHAFLTVMLEDKDVLLQVDLETLRLKRVRYFTRDTHLFSPALSKNFFLLESATGAIHELSKEDLWEDETVYGPEGVHGVTGSETGDFLVVTDIDAQGSEPSILVYEKIFGRLRLRTTAKTPHPVAHNVSLVKTHGLYSLFVTHSGAASANVSRLVFNVSRRELRFDETLTTGPNPFGILAIP